MAVITFIGSGQMASALTFPAFENDNEVRLVGSPLDNEIIEQLKKDNYHKTLKRTLPDGIKYYYKDEIKEALKGADVVIGGVSSFGVDWFGNEVLPLINPDIPVLTVTKGMINQDDGSMITYLDYWNSLTNNQLNLNAIGGPCTSYELADHDNSAVTFTGSNLETLKYLKNLFKTDYYNISLSNDIQGVEFAVALKNAYALAVTLAVGLSEKKEGPGILHYNSQAALFMQSAKEMNKLLELADVLPENVFLGIGDLYVTVFGGRTRRIGTLLGKGYNFEEAMKELQGVTLESIVITKRTAEAVKELAKRGKVDLNDFPLLLHIDEIINKNKEVNIPWEKFESITIKN